MDTHRHEFEFITTEHTDYMDSFLRPSACRVEQHSCSFVFIRG
jgi:hypothetical protein